MKIREIKNKGRPLIEPITDKAMFYHCAGGLVAVTPKKFKDEVQPLLFHHGISFIEFEEVES